MFGWSMSFQIMFTFRVYFLRFKMLLKAPDERKLKSPTQSQFQHTSCWANMGHVVSWDETDKRVRDRREVRGKGPSEQVSWRQRLSPQSRGGGYSSLPFFWSGPHKSIVRWQSSKRRIFSFILNAGRNILTNQNARTCATSSTVHYRTGKGVKFPTQ